ncbi:MAG TPA: histidinol dehydrogenase, partial [Spirochaetota bacterium]|nr:histidinol dehydrogenase [Spirochaetota bacterium]
MIKIKHLSELTEQELSGLFNRFGSDFSEIMIKTVVPIVNDVRARGDEAVIEYTGKFDRVKTATVLAAEEEIENGYRSVPGEVIDAFMEAKENIEDFHHRQLRDDIRYTRDDGTVLGVSYQPIGSAAMYVPGGKASYPSS